MYDDRVWLYPEAKVFDAIRFQSLANSLLLLFLLSHPPAGYCRMRLSDTDSYKYIGFAYNATTTACFYVEENVLS